MTKLVFGVDSSNVDEACNFLLESGYVVEAADLKRMFSDPNRRMVKMHVSGDGSAKALANAVRSATRFDSMSERDKMVLQFETIYELALDGLRQMKLRYNPIRTGYDEQLSGIDHCLDFIAVHSSSYIPNDRRKKIREEVDARNVTTPSTENNKGDAS